MHRIAGTVLGQIVALSGEPPPVIEHRRWRVVTDAEFSDESRAVAGSAEQCRIRLLSLSRREIRGEIEDAVAARVLPVKIDARLIAQTGLVTYAFLNATPSRASASRFGVLMMLLPAKPTASQRWSSASRKMMLGRAGESLPRPDRQPACLRSRPRAREWMRR